MKKTITALAAVLLFVCCIPFHISAESETYVLLGANENILASVKKSNNANNYVSSLLGGRVCAVASYSLDYTGQNLTNVFYVTLDPNSKYSMGTNPIDSPNGNLSSGSYDGVTFYYAYSTDSSYVNNTYYVPVYNPSENESLSSRASRITMAYRLTYGDLAIGEDTPAPVSYGSLASLGYYTKIAGSGLSSVNNVDVITWDPAKDSNGEFVALKGYQASVEIKAVSSHYQAQTLGLLNSLGWQDVVIDQEVSADLATQLFTGGTFEISWGSVAAALDQTVDQISGYKYNETDWRSMGWVYYARLVVPDAEFEGSWQLIYSSSAAPPAINQNITGSDQLSPELINSILEINSQNGTTNNWTINNYEINTTNPDDQTQTDKPWWAYLLEAIISILGNIVDAIKDLILGILDLFRFDTFEIPDFNEKKELYIEHTGLFGQTLKFHESVTDLLTGVEVKEPVFYYPGFELDNVQLIPEVSVNLNDYMQNETLSNLHAMAYTVTDGLIALLLLLQIKDKIMRALSK